MLWRKFLPHTLYKGRKGGKKHTQRPRWVGPGRVVLHELVPGQDESDRRQIVWVILGNVLYRASVHSVRPLSDREQQLFEAQGDDSHRWKELSDMIPKRNYVDVVNEEPLEEEMEIPSLPDLPGNKTIIPPKIRFAAKMPISNYGFPIPDKDELLPHPPLEELTDGVNDYSPDDLPLDHPLAKKQKTHGDEIEDEEEITIPTSSSRRTSTSSKTPLLGELPRPPEEPVHHGRDDQDEPPEEPESKKARLDSDEDDLMMDICQAVKEVDSGYLMEIDLDFSSNR